MKTKLTPFLLSAALLCGAASPVFADGTEGSDSGDAYKPYQPKTYDLSRYEHMDKKSPFEFEPPKVEEVAAVDPFEGVSLAGYAGTGNTLTVYLLVGKEKKRVTVYGDGSPFKGTKRDDSGFRVVGLKKGKSLGTSEVTIEKDGQQKAIKFDPETLKNAKGGAGGQGGVQMVPDGKGGMVPRPVIPRPGVPGGPQVNNNMQPPAAFVPGQTPAPAMNNGAVVNPQNGVTPQQGINNMTVPQPGVPTVPQLNIPNTVQPGGAPGGVDAVRSGRRRVVLPTNP